MIKENIKKSLDKNPELSWTFLDGSKRTAVILSTAAIGKGKYLPGWIWSKHVGAMTGKESEVHIGYIFSGKMVVRDSEGKETELGPGDTFEVQPGHDAWVSGNEPCIALDFSSL